MIQNIIPGTYLQILQLFKNGQDESVSYPSSGALILIKQSFKRTDHASLHSVSHFPAQLSSTGHVGRKKVPGNSLDLTHYYLLPGGHSDRKHPGFITEQGGT
jgi:hypothetical protein